MRRVFVHSSGSSVAIEIDGQLEIVAAYDLRAAVTSALATSDGVITFDLSRVTGVDADGIEALQWSCERANAVRRPLLWTRCSQPVRRDLREALGRGRAQVA